MITSVTTIDCPTPGMPVPEDDGLGIPDELKVANRKPLSPEAQKRLDEINNASSGSLKDSALGVDRKSPIDSSAVKVLSEIAARKVAKAQARKAAKEAAKAGDTAKMPLQGNAAIAAIRDAGGSKKKAKTDRLPIPPRAPRGQDAGAAAKTDVATAPKPAKKTAEAAPKPERKPTVAKKKTAAAKAPKTSKAKPKAAKGPSKGDRIVVMLKSRWTPMQVILEETGWLAHTARAWISRLRSVEKLNVETKRTDEGTQYRIVP